MAVTFALNVDCSFWIPFSLPKCLNVTCTAVKWPKFFSPIGSTSFYITTNGLKIPIEWHLFSGLYIFSKERNKMLCFFCFLYKINDKSTAVLLKLIYFLIIQAGSFLSLHDLPNIKDEKCDIMLTINSAADLCLFIILIKYSVQFDQNWVITYFLLWMFPKIKAGLNWVTRINFLRLTMSHNEKKQLVFNLQFFSPIYLCIVSKIRTWQFF